MKKRKYLKIKKKIKRKQFRKSDNEARQRKFNIQRGDMNYKTNDRNKL